ncbi:WG repeat-containing protein [Budviciaceae bacterium BWR-B9]|uniref:WG repeat-containing protein n=1 Tax=Limnobaculum allomyrinae TaxID=2791986 RepID=A0ABS1ILS5_9GAMM|nr:MULTISPECIES: WG repeat-containing protein [Limnobaculum]MBK5142700.1 WG repeat-containing protein [Limnobaculum allomyrinae]MBV7690414.1 WG repeat-containing protein [Limnobaculum sp. M2-1]
MSKVLFHLPLKYALLSLSLLCSTHLLAQEHAITPEMETELRNEFKKYSFPQIKKRLREQSDSLKKYQEFSSIRISAGSTTDQQTEHVDKFIPLSATEINSKYHEYLNSLSFYQSISGDLSTIQTNYNSYHLSQLIKNYDDYNYPEHELNITSVTFIDGSTATISSADTEGKGSLNGTKRIASLSMTASYTLPLQSKQLHFSHGDKSVEEQIELVQMSGQEVELKLSESVHKNILHVEGIDSSGQALKPLGSSSYSNDNYYISLLYTFTEQALQQIESHQITDKEALLQFFLNNYPSQEQTHKTHPPVFIATYQFQGEVSAINLYLYPESKRETYSFQLTQSDQRYFNGLTSAQDNTGKKYGLISEQGEWIIAPRYNRLEYAVGDYYYATEAHKNVNDTSVYRLNRNEKRLELQPFRFSQYEPKLLQNKYVYITKENDRSRLQGLLNIQTHQIILPVKYSDIEISDNFFGAYNINNKKFDRNYEIYSSHNLQLILKGTFDVVTFDSSNIITRYTTRTIEPLKGNTPYYAIENDKYYLYQHYDIYDVNGKKLNDNHYYQLDSFSSFGKDGLLPVTDAHGKRYYINRSGKNAGLDVSKYETIYPFSNGLAAVKGVKDEYGYIDTSGKLVIPLIYRSAEMFQGGSAKVENDKVTLLIDRKNQIIHTFNDSVYTYTNHQDSDKATYTQYNGVTYDEKGQEVVKKKDK